MQVYEELRGLGYDGGYDAVRRYAAGWRRVQGSGTAAAFVPLLFAPGEAYQFDWSHEVVLIDGVTVTMKVALVRLCHSRMFFVRAIHARPRRWCSMPMTGLSPSSGEPAPGASTIVRFGRHRFEARPNEDGGGHDLRRQGPRL